jgi:isoleucyl-tRNA synthetase
VWRVVDEWYISMDKLRKPLEEITKKVNWIPEFGKDRELDWLKNMHDWLISKKRYWGLALPIFECQKCGTFEVIGSKEELEKRAVEGWDKFEGNSPHKPWIDNVKIECKKCKEKVSRIKDVGNPWLDAGIVPFSTMKYSSDNAYWKKWFPAELVCESFPGQFKNWFYSLLVMSAVLEEKPPMKTIFGYATVHDEKDEEMHKSKGNAIWFDEAAEKAGVDPIRWVCMKQNPADNLRFGYNILDEAKRKLLTLYNVYTFLETYVKKEELAEENLKTKSENILDRWIVSKTDHLISSVEFSLEKYDAGKAVSAIEDFFINDLSLWYVRRSRKRFHEASPDRKEAIATLYYVLLNIAKLIAPVMPFFAEEMYQSLRAGKMEESVHLCDWPSVEDKGQTDLELEGKMDEVRKIVNLALAERSEKGIKVRQPLSKLKIKSEKSKIENEKELLDLIKEEVNVKEIVFVQNPPADGEKEVELDTEITKELKQEGMIRDILRQVQDMRKEAGLKPEDRISIWFSSEKDLETVLENNKDFIVKEVKIKDFNIGLKPEEAMGKEILIDGKKLLIGIKK